MTTKLSDDLRQAIEKQGGSPVHVVDAATNVHYVLMRADEYERITANTGVEDVEAMGPSCRNEPTTGRISVTSRYRTESGPRAAVAGSVSERSGQF